MAIFKTLIRVGVITAIVAGGAVVIAGPRRAAAMYGNAHGYLMSVIDANIDDPTALRAQLRDLQEQYPERIADVRGDLAELNEQRRQVQREHSIAQRVVTLTNQDLAALTPLVAQAEAASLSVERDRIVAVRFDNSTMEVGDARSRCDQITRTQAVYASRKIDAERDLKYLDAQAQRLEALLSQLETERADFQTQIWQLDRQVDAIARNDRLIGLMAKRQRTIDECSKYEANSLSQLHVKMAEVRSRQEAELEMLASDQQRMDYEDVARLQLDAGMPTVFDPETAEPLVLNAQPLILTEVEVIGPTLRSH
jgi:chromosome segregation ATPase